VTVWLVVKEIVVSPGIQVFFVPGPPIQSGIKRAFLFFSFFLIKGKSRNERDVGAADLMLDSEGSPKKRVQPKQKKMNPKWNQVGGEKLVGYVVCVSCKTNPAVVELKSQTSGKWWRTRLADDVDPSTDSMAID